MKHILEYSTYVFENLNNDELKSLEEYADYLFSKLGVSVVFTKHFKQRINEIRSGQEITYDQMAELFRKAYWDAGQEIADLPPETEAVLKDKLSKLNIPFKVQEDPDGKEHDLILKTIMRKTHFSTPNPEIII
jgi:hypothetical protein